MLTQREKQMLLDLLSKVQIAGDRAFVTKKLEELDALTRKVEAMPVDDPGEPAGEEKKPVGSDAGKASKQRSRRHR